MRVDWVDNAKAMGIVAIVLGHAPGLDPQFRAFLYSFHVPLFFFLSGFLLKPSHVSTSWGRYVARDVRRLLVPYVFFWVISFALWFAFQTVAGKLPIRDPQTMLMQLNGLLLGTSDKLLVVNGALWFFTSLFVTSVLFYFVARLQRPSRIGLAVLAFAPLGWLFHLWLQGAHWPWNLDLVFVAMFFFGLGYLARLQDWASVLRDNRVSLVVFAVALGLTIASTLINGRADFSWQDFGSHYGLYLLGSMAGISMVVALAKLIPMTSVARYLSENSLTIFSLHFPMFFAFSGIGHYIFKLPEGFDHHSTPIGLLYTALALLLCVVAVWILRRYFAWFIGVRPALLTT